MKQEKQEVPEVQNKEKHYYLDDYPDEVLRAEFNLIDFPIFTKDKSIEENMSITYYFNQKGTKYFKITPPNDPDLKHKKIPQEFDEMIFYALLRLYERQRSSKLITDYGSLLRLANKDPQSGYNRKRLKNSINRLKGCELSFKNVFYKAFNKEIEGAKVIGTDAKMNLIDKYFTLTLDSVDDLAYEDQKERIKNYFNNNKRLKKVLFIDLNDLIVKNMEHKAGFRFFNAEELLQIANSVTRKLYLWIPRWAYWHPGNKFIESLKLITSRIPLDWNTPTNRGNTKRRLVNAADELVERGLLKNYRIIREGSLKDAKMSFVVNEDRVNGLVKGKPEKDSAPMRNYSKVSVEKNKCDEMDLELNKKQKEYIDKITPRHMSKKGAMSLLYEYADKEEIDYLIFALRKAVNNHTKNVRSLFKSIVDSDNLHEEYKDKKQRLASLKKKEEKRKEREKAKKKKEEERRTEAEEIYKQLDEEELMELRNIDKIVI